MSNINQNELNSAICDMYDIQNRIKIHKLADLPKDDEGSETTIGNCVNDVLEFLVNLKKVVCSICKKEIDPKKEYQLGHNAEPVSSERCCTKCNYEHVIPVRIADIVSRNKSSKNKLNKFVDDLYSGGAK